MRRFRSKPTPIAPARSLRRMLFSAGRIRRVDKPMPDPNARQIYRDRGPRFDRSAAADDGRAVAGVLEEFVGELQARPRKESVHVSQPEPPAQQPALQKEAVEALAVGSVPPRPEAQVNSNGRANIRSHGARRSAFRLVHAHDRGIDPVRYASLRQRTKRL
jgi:hypothetical protein